MPEQDIQVGDILYLAPVSFPITDEAMDSRGSKARATVVALYAHYFTVEFQLRGGSVKESYQYWDLNAAERA